SRSSRSLSRGTGAAEGPGSLPCGSRSTLRSKACRSWLSQSVPPPLPSYRRQSAPVTSTCASKPRSPARSGPPVRRSKPAKRRECKSHKGKAQPAIPPPSHALTVAVEALFFAHGVADALDHGAKALRGGELYRTLSFLRAMPFSAKFIVGDAVG